jgi:transcriptional regulator with XRE-family HTH domain
MANFGELLRRLRGKRSQKEVAVELDMPVTTLSTLENQSGIPRGAMLKRLADHYGVPLVYFYASVASEMKSSDSAKEWLKSVKENTDAKDAIAAHAPPDYPDQFKTKITEKIRQEKNAKTTRGQ